MKSSDEYEAAIATLARLGSDCRDVTYDIAVAASKNRCAFCDAYSELLCDYRHGWSNWEMDGERRVITINSVQERCDAPLCVKCTTNKGRVFDLNGPGSIDTFDACPLHANRDMEPADDYPFITKGNAEQIRLKNWKMRILQRDRTAQQGLEL